MSKQHLKNRRFLIPLLFTFLLAVIGGMYAATALNGALDTKPNSLSALNAKKTAKKLHETCSKNPSRQSRNKISCYSDSLYTLTLKTDILFAFSIMSSLQERDEDTKECHLLAHAIGHAAFDKDPENFRQTLQKIPKICTFGGIHGVLEAFSQKNEDWLSEKVIPTLCGENPAGSCIHIVGHLLTVETGDDIKKVEKLCENAFTQNRVQRQDCLTGAYMEHMSKVNLIAHGMVPKNYKFNVAKDIVDFENLCKNATSDSAIACWSEIAYVASRYFKNDPEKVLEFCQRAQNEDAVFACSRYGTAITFAEAKFDFLNYKLVCEKKQPNDPAFKKDCYVLLVNTAMANLPARSSNSVVDFCLSLTSEYQALCFKTINSSFTRLSRTQKDRDQVCGFVPSAYQSICKGKYHVKSSALRDENATPDVMLKNF